MNYVQQQGRRGYRFINWSRTNQCEPELYFEPSNVDQLKQILAASRANNKHVRIVGSGHAISGIQCSPHNGGLACTSDYMVSMKHFNRLLQVWPEKKQAKIEPGIVIKDLNVALERQNLAMEVLPDFDVGTLGGLLSTDVHASGRNVHILQHYIVELELLLASGETIILSREKDEESFLAAALSFGSMGIILSVVLQCAPAFNLLVTRATAPLQQVLENIQDSVSADDYFVVSWRANVDNCMVIRATKTAMPVIVQPSWFWITLIGIHFFEFLFFIASFFWILNIHVTRLYLWIFGSKSTVITSYKFFKANYLPFFTTEHAIPSQMIAPVLTEMKEWMRKNNYSPNMGILIRYVRADDFYLSPAYGRDVFYICNDTYWPYHRTINHERYWKACEEICLKFGGRPHWGKSHEVTSQQFKFMYPMWNKFHDIRRKLDPRGMFMNEYLEKAFGHN